MLLKKWLFLLFLAFGLQASLSAQLQFGLNGGIMLGGPIPDASEPVEGTGKMAVGPAGSAFVRLPLAERWQFSAGLGYAFKGASYSQTYQRDTMMAIEIFPGFLDTVPTYYVADVKGKMGLHYLEMPLQFRWNIKGGAWLNFGGYAALLLGGKDAGTLDIQIGDGTVFPDTNAVFDNIEEIRRLDAGICLGGSYEWDWGLMLELRAQRSLFDVYRPGFLASQGLAGTRLFHTQFYIGLGWLF